MIVGEVHVIRRAQRADTTNVPVVETTPGPLSQYIVSKVKRWLFRWWWVLGNGLLRRWWVLGNGLLWWWWVLLGNGLLRWWHWFFFVSCKCCEPPSCRTSKSAPHYLSSDQFLPLFQRVLLHDLVAQAGPGGIRILTCTRFQRFLGKFVEIFRFRVQRTLQTSGCRMSL